MKKIFYLLPALLYFTFFMPADGLDLKKAEIMLTQMNQQASHSLSDPKLSGQERQNRFRHLLLKWFDIKNIGQFVLGNYWRRFSPAEQKEFQQYFETYLVKTWADAFKNYTSESFKIVKSSERAQFATAIISTHIDIIQNGAKKTIKVDWRLKYMNNAYKITDIIVENVSMAITRRKEFTALIQENKANSKKFLESFKKKVDTL